MCRLAVRSFGYGIIMVEAVGPDLTSEDDMKRLLGAMFTGVSEWVSRSDDPQRALVMVSEGHAPTKYELSQLESEDWEWMRDVVDERGTQAFSDRLSMLEGCRNPAIAPADARAPAS